MSECGLWGFRCGSDGWGGWFDQSISGGRGGGEGSLGWKYEVVTEFKGWVMGKGSRMDFLIIDNFAHIPNR